MRVLLIGAGLAVVLFQQCLQPISPEVQSALFFAGVLLLGIPHGAADLLVAAQNANLGKKKFSHISFFAGYLGRLLLFAVFIRLFPLAGFVLFLFFAAAHFGETDLHRFKTETLAGKLLITAYGLVILSVILLIHFEEVRPILLLFDSSTDKTALFNGLEGHRYLLTGASGVLLLGSVVYYFRVHPGLQPEMKFVLLQFVCLLLILCLLPMLLGFTFYFVVWHAVLSLTNITLYLRKGNAFSQGMIAKQILLYSLLALTGIGLFGLTGFMFLNTRTLLGYLILGLAVLTAPHMQVMHDMYNTLRHFRLSTR